MTQILPLLPKQRMQNLKLWPLRGGYSTLRKTTQRKINQTLIRFNYVMQKPQRNHSLSKYLKYLRKLRFRETALLLSCLIRVNVLVLYKNHLKFFHLKPCNLMWIYKSTQRVTIHRNSVVEDVWFSTTTVIRTLDKSLSTTVVQEKRQALTSSRSTGIKCEAVTSIRLYQGFLSSFSLTEPWLLWSYEVQMPYLKLS